MSRKFTIIFILLNISCTQHSRVANNQHDVTCEASDEGLFWYKQCPNHNPVQTEKVEIKQENFQKRNITATYYCAKKIKDVYIFGKGKNSGVCSPQLEDKSHPSVSVPLGASFHLNCKMDGNDVYLYNQRTADPPVVMIMFFYVTALPDPVYYTKPDSAFQIFRQDDTIHLNITEVTEDHTGAYYCAQRKQKPSSRQWELHFTAGKTLLTVASSGSRICSSCWILLLLLVLFGHK